MMYDSKEITKRGRGCACHTPRLAEIMAERASLVAQARQKPHASLAERTRTHHAKKADPIILKGAGAGSVCRPHLVIQKDPEKFAACNAFADELGPLDDPKKAFRIIEEAIGDEVNEVFGIMTLDLHLRFKSIAETGRGEPAAVMAPLAPTLQVALMDGAHAAIIFHVHPSGVEAEPSDADKETTQAFVEAFEIVNVHLLDHVIIGGDIKKRSYYSFAEDGAL